jgi:ketosteroid isomerase-like protein
MSDQETAVLTATADEWNVAMCSNDAERIGDFMADDWVIVSESGVSTTRITNTAHYDGRQYDADEWTTDVFARQDGRWRCVLSHITPAVEAKIEGIEP